jgi:hypothetical protein
MKKLFLLLALGAFLTTVAVPTNSFASAASAPQEKKDEKKSDKACSKDKKDACCKAKKDSENKGESKKVN